MAKNRFAILLIFIYIIVLIFQYGIYHITLQNHLDEPLAAKAAARISFCYNHPPTIIINCNATLIQNDNYLCQVNVTDFDNTTPIYNSIFLSATDLFSITTQGLINFTSNQSHVGFHSVLLSVNDNSSCGNSVDINLFNFEIQNINDPPYLIEPIPNQSFDQDTSLLAFDLDDYFADPDNDPLNYTTTLLDNIEIIIDSNNEVTFIPTPGYYGIEEAIFFAWDPYFANASSNIVYIRVIEVVQPSDTIIQTSTSSSGGGGSFGNVPSCLPKWYCRPWGQCEPDSFIKRDCYDLNNCTSTFGKPNVTQPCDFISTCFDGFKGPEEEDIDCGGPCPSCGTCYDNTCNNNEDCTRDLTNIPDCGGNCQECVYITESCYDNICNNNEDCTQNLTDIPDCGGPCDTCLTLENPIYKSALNFGLIFLIISSIILSMYAAKKMYPYLLALVKKRKRKIYEERLLLETKITESILESLLKIEKMLDTQNLEKIIMLFSALVRKYFKHLFELGYEFTYEEIIKEIQSININPSFKFVLKSFFDRSLELEFSGKSVTKEELRASITEFKVILSLTSKEPLDIKEPELKLNIKLNKTEKMFQKITLAESSLRTDNINKAYSLYIELIKDFSNLETKNKAKLHGFISRLHDEIKLERELYSKNQTNLDSLN